MLTIQDGTSLEDHISTNLSSLPMSAGARVSAPDPSLDCSSSMGMGQSLLYDLSIPPKVHGLLHTSRREQPYPETS